MTYRLRKTFPRFRGGWYHHPFRWVDVSGLRGVSGTKGKGKHRALWKFLLAHRDPDLLGIVQRITETQGWSEQRLYRAWEGVRHHVNRFGLCKEDIRFYISVQQGFGFTWLREPDPHETAARGIRAKAIIRKSMRLSLKSKRQSQAEKPKPSRSTETTPVHRPSSTPTW